jgi:hypothetical protein
MANFSGKKFGLFILIFLVLMGMIAAPIALGVYHSWLPMIGSLLVDGLAIKPLSEMINKLME